MVSVACDGVFASRQATHSSESGVIFFSSISSSPYVFLYFSQFEPVAEGYVRLATNHLAINRDSATRDAYHDCGG